MGYKPVYPVENWQNTNILFKQLVKEKLDKISEDGKKLNKEVDDLFFKQAFMINTSNSVNSKVALWKGDITTLKVDAIVNAARPSLLGGGGIDHAIHAAAGPKLLEACRPLNGCKHGETKVTPAFDLPCRYVLHTVGPNRDLHTDKEAVYLLQKSYLTCMARVLEYDLKSVALSCISTGAYRYPSRQAAHIALSTIRLWLEIGTNSDAVGLIIFNTFTDEDYLNYLELMQFYFPVAKSFWE